jgi:hypothetical protein
MNITIIILDIIYRLDIYLKQDFTESGFCLSPGDTHLVGSGNRDSLRWVGST